jgi:hypothetical protein
MACAGCSSTEEGTSGAGGTGASAADSGAGGAGGSGGSGGSAGSAGSGGAAGSAGTAGSGGAAGSGGGAGSGGAGGSAGGAGSGGGAGADAGADGADGSAGSGGSAGADAGDASLDVPSSGSPDPVYGVTIDDPITGNAALVKALSAMTTQYGVKPTARIVFDAGTRSTDYTSAVAAIHAVAYVLATPVDSTEMGLYPTSTAYVDRFKDVMSAVGASVDVWEVGNEINGQGWLGLSSTQVGANVYAAWQYIHGLGLKTELTPYMFRPGDQTGDYATMEGWLDKYVCNHADMKTGLDYVLVSYYDDDNGGQHEAWTTMFDNLLTRFPASQLGFGECGFGLPQSAGTVFDQRVDEYYKMPKYNASYVGGYFWWYWAEDCKSTSDTRWIRIAEDCQWMSTNLR